MYNSYNTSNKSIDKSKKYNWYDGRQVTSKMTKVKATIYKIIYEVFRNKIQKKHDPELHKFLKRFS